MIKGINKQIIEVKCTNNEYFEKILLFVKGEKADLPNEILNNQALGIFNAITAGHVIKNRGKIIAGVLRIVLLSSVGFTFGIFVASLFM